MDSLTKISTYIRTSCKLQADWDVLRHAVPTSAPPPTYAHVYEQLQCTQGMHSCIHKLSHKIVIAKADMLVRSASPYATLWCRVGGVNDCTWQVAHSTDIVHNMCTLIVTQFSLCSCKIGLHGRDSSEEDCRGKVFESFGNLFMQMRN